MAQVMNSVQCFGKLPIAGDFIRYRLGDEETKAFAAWVEKGQALVEAVRRGYRPLPGQKPSGETAPRRYRFALDLGLGRRIVLGILHESHDKGKLRRFPFAFFTTAEAAPFRSRPGLIPMALGDVWQVMEASMSTLQEAADSAALFKKLEEVDIPVAEPSGASAGEMERRLQGAGSGTLWEQLFGSGDPQRKLLLFDVLVRALSSAAKVRPEESPVFLKLPLAGSPEDVALQSAFWVELLAGILRGGRKAPSLFLAAPEASKPARSLHIFFQRPDEKSFASLMSETHESEHVDDLTGRLSFGKSGPALGRNQRRLLEDGRASLLDIVRSFWT